MSSANTPTQAVVETVAAVEGVDPLELQPPLFEAIDPEALDTLITSANPDTTVQFVYHEYTITVDSDCNVELEPVSREPEPTQAVSTQCD